MPDDTTTADVAAPENAAPEDATPEPVIPADPVAAALVERFPGSVAVESHGQWVVYVDRGQWRDVAAHLRTQEQFTQCVDVTAVDHAADVERFVVAGVAPERFEVVANFLSHPRNLRIRTICEVPASDPEVPSLVGEFPGVAFPERETYDMFGITFTDHAELARILMPDDWVGHPLRKDDPPGRIPVTFKGDPGPR